MNIDALLRILNDKQHNTVMFTLLYFILLHGFHQFYAHEDVDKGDVENVKEEGHFAGLFKVIQHDTSKKHNSTFERMNDRDCSRFLVLNCLHFLSSVQEWNTEEVIHKSSIDTVRSIEHNCLHSLIR